MKKALRNQKNKTLLLFVSMLTCALFVACGKDKKNTETPLDGVAAVEKVTDVSVEKELANRSLLNPALVSRLPELTAAIYEWDGASSAFEKFSSSPWSGSQAIKKLRESLDSEQVAMFERLGVRLDKNLDVFQKAVLFVSLLSEEQKSAELSEQEKIARSFLPFAEVGLIFSSKGGEAFKSRMPVIEDELKKNSIAYERFTSGEIEGVVLNDILSAVDANKAKDSQSKQGLERLKKNKISLVLASDGVLNTLTLEKSLAERLLAPVGETTKNPPLVSEPAYQQSLLGVGSLENAYANGYLDLARVISVFPEESRPKGKSLLSALKDLSVVAGMDSAPFGFYHMGLDKEKWEMPKLVADSFGNSLSKLPGNPLITFSVNSGLLNLGFNFAESLVDIAAAQGVDPKAKKHVADIRLAAEVLTTGVNRSTLVLEAPTPGASFLPIPGVTLILDVKDAGAKLADIKSQLDTLFKSGGIPVSPKWVESKLTLASGEKTVLSRQSAIGVGLHLLADEALLYVASDLNQLKATLAGGESGLLARLDTPSQEMFAKQSEALALHLAYKGIAGMLTNFKDMLAMYAPQQGNEDYFGELSEQMSQMGDFLLGVEIKPEGVTARARYSQSAAK